MDRTYLESETAAYPNGGETRKGKAIYPDGIIRTVYGGIPDTFFSIPAHGRLKGAYVKGYLSIEDDLDNANYGELTFTIYPQYLPKEDN